MLIKTLFTFKNIIFFLIFGSFLAFFLSCSPKGIPLVDTTNTDVIANDSGEEDIEIGDNAIATLPKAFIDSIPEDMKKWYDDDTLNGEIRIDVRDDYSVPNWSDFTPKAVSNDSMPNILFILYDDTGLGAWSPYGGAIRMPTLDSIAANGLIYTQWHTTALCSPTRSTIMTGRNHHLNGMASITESADGFPGANGRVPEECMPFAEVLQNNGYSTFWLGKNHNVPETDVAPGGYRGEWPCQQGFDRYYGFLGGETNNWYPDLVEDNRFIEAPSTPEDSDDPVNFPEEGYHLSRDLADKALEMLRNQQASNPHKPWYMWYCPGANHAPHHSPPSYTQEYIERGIFEEGYDLYRENIHQEMINRGILPANTALPDYNFLDTQTRNPLDTIIKWDDLDVSSQDLFVRMAQVYAGFSTYTDVQIGRIIDYLKETDQYENTIIMYAADNGASGEGSPVGSVNENKFFNGYPDKPEDNIGYLDDLGTAETYNHFPTGWASAFSTPFKMFKRYSQFAGGTNDPLVISWPKYMKENDIEGGTLRHQYHHSVDIVPTLLEATGLEMPDTNKGVAQKSLSGTSMLYTFKSQPYAPTKKEVQYYCMLGTRGIWQDGWKALELHAPTSGNGNFSDEGWELYRIDTLYDKSGTVVLSGDRSESTNLAQTYPERLDALIATWYEQAAINNVLPLDDRAADELFAIERPNPEPNRNVYRYYPKTAAVPEGVAVNVRGRPYTIEATITTDPDPNVKPEGVLFAHGSRFGGHTMYIKGDTLKYLYNFLGISYKQYEANLQIINGLEPNTEYTFEAHFDITGVTDTAYVGNVSLMARKGLAYIAITQLTGINTQPGKFTLSGDGLCVGYDSADAVTTNYPNPKNKGAFSGGSIKYVTVRVEGKPIRNAKLDSRAMMLRH